MTVEEQKKKKKASERRKLLESMVFCPFTGNVCYAVEKQRPEYCALAVTQGSKEKKVVMCAFKRMAISLSRIEWAWKLDIIEQVKKIKEQAKAEAKAGAKRKRKTKKEK